MGSEVSDDFQVSMRREGELARVSLELSEAERREFRTAALTVHRPDGTSFERPMRWRNRHTLEVDFPLDQSGAHRE